jgi:dTDP-4-dehydrorhamnose reductase
VKIFIAGSKGQLGKALLKQQPPRNMVLTGADVPVLDITDPLSVERVLAEHQPAMIINAAAYTDVDRAEDEPRNAFSANRDGPAHLAEYCVNAGIPLIHLSTDYVFNGSKDRPYRESDPIIPLGVYGKSKAEGENEIRTRLTEHVIVRTSWMYGVDGKNFVKTILRAGRENDTLKIVSDQHGSPTCADDLAKVLITIADRLVDDDDRRWGTFHYCGLGSTSWFEFAVAIFDNARQFGLPRIPQLLPVKTAEWPTRAVRPPYSVLNCSLINNIFGITPVPWQDSLKKTVERLMHAGT